MRLGLRFQRKGSRILIGSIGVDVPGAASAVDAKSFGAVGDGASHPLSQQFKTLEQAQSRFPFVESLDEEADRAAIQAALDTACNVHVPAGLYVLGERGLALDGGKQLWGDGPICTVLRYWGDDAALRANSGIGSVTHSWAVRGLGIYCNPSPGGGAAGQYGLRIGQLYSSPLSAHAGVVENVRLIGAGKAGLHLRASQINHLRGVDASSNAGDGCLVDAPLGGANTATHFYACTFRENGKRGLYSTGGIVFSFHGCTFELNGEEGCRLWRPDVPEHAARNWVFERCYFELNNKGQSGSFANFFIDSEWLAGVEKHGKWQHVELRRCYLTQPGEGNWNVRAGRCQLVIWYAETPAPPVIGTDTGSSAVDVAIWGDGAPAELWQIGSPAARLMFHSVRGGTHQFYANSGGEWTRAAIVSGGGVFTDGELEVADPSHGVVLASPNGSRWRVTVDDQGDLQAVVIPPPPSP